MSWVWGLKDRHLRIAWVCLAESLGLGLVVFLAGCATVLDRGHWPSGSEIFCFAALAYQCWWVPALRAFGEYSWRSFVHAVEERSGVLASRKR